MFRCARATAIPAQLLFNPCQALRYSAVPDGGLKYLSNCSPSYVNNVINVNNVNKNRICALRYKLYKLYKPYKLFSNIILFTSALYFCICSESFLKSSKDEAGSLYSNPVASVIQLKVEPLKEKDE